MQEINETGGARVGMINMSQWFATLVVNKNMLQLNCSIAGTFLFRPTDIISIEPYNKLLKRGIKINHNVSNYYPTIIFMGGSSTELIERIKQTGFLDNMSSIPYETEILIADIQTNGPFPLRVPAAILIVLIWNVCIFADLLGWFGKKLNNIPIGIGAQLATGFMLTVAILLLIAEPVRQLILKEGRSIKPLRGFLYFIIFILSILFLAVSTLPHIAYQ